MPKWEWSDFKVLPLRGFFGNYFWERKMREEFLKSHPELADPIGRFVDVLIILAVKSKATQIRIRQAKGSLALHYRIEGVFHAHGDAPTGFMSKIVERLRDLSGCQGKELPFRSEFSFASNSLPSGDVQVKALVDREAIDLDLGTNV